VGPGNTVPHSLKGRLVAIAMQARSSRSVMTWNSNSAPRVGRGWRGCRGEDHAGLSTQQPVTLVGKCSEQIRVVLA